jgi:hypothetical protein
MAHVEFTWVKPHGGILLNEWADQLATCAVLAGSYRPEIVVPADERESGEEYVIEDEDVTQWEDRTDTDHLPPTGTSVISVGPAAEEERERQDGSLQRFRPSAVSDILKRAMVYRPFEEEQDAAFANMRIIAI